VARQALSGAAGDPRAQRCAARQQRHATGGTGRCADAAIGAKRLAIIGKTAPQVLADYVEAVEVVEPASVPRVVPSDADDYVIAAAIAGTATLIVSGDSNLLSMSSRQGIEILSAAMALESIRATGKT